MQPFAKMLAPILAACLATACASQPASYTEHDPRIVGTWYIADLVPYDNSYFEKTYFADGTACGFEFDNAVDGSHIGFFKSVWHVKDGKLISTPISSTLDGVPKGEPIVDKIISVTPTVMTLRGIEGGAPYNRYRYPEDRGDMLCHLHDLSSPGASGKGP